MPGSISRANIVDGSAFPRSSRVNSAMSVFLFLLGRFRGGFESIESTGPVLVEERAQTSHLFDVGAIEPTIAGASFTHEIRLSQHAQMLGDRRTRDVVKVRSDVGGGHFARPDKAQNLATLGIGDCFERGVHGSSVSECLRKKQLKLERIFRSCLGSSYARSSTGRGR